MLFTLIGVSTMLKKTATALAVSLLALGAHSAELTAGKDTKFEVNVDVGAYYLSKKSNTGVSEDEFLGKGLNQVEIKASHKLANGTSVFGEIEVDYDPIGDTGEIKTADVRLGFSNPAWGRLSVGQFDSFFEDNVMEVLGVGRGENGFMTEPNATKVSLDGRRVQYSHQIGSLSFAADLTFSTSKADSSKSDTGIALAASYKFGDLTLSAGHSDNPKYLVEKPASGSDLQPIKSATGLAATYKIGNAKLLGLYATEKAAATSIKTNFLGAGITYTMGDLNLGFSTQQRKVDGGKKYNEWSAGIGYNIYKGMEAYLDLNGLDDTNSKGDIIEVGIRYSF
jgi:predicted porin